MPITWIEVADTAVKIGLGAVITGASAYLLAGRNHAHTLARDLTARRISILESACADVEEYFSYCTQLYNVVGAFAGRNDADGRDQTEEEKKVIAQLHENFQQALDARNKARAKISLLGATAALGHITKFNDALGRYRKIIAHDAKMLSSQQQSAMTEEFREHKQAFYEAAAEFMRKAGSGRGT